MRQIGRRSIAGRWRLVAALTLALILAACSVAIGVTNSPPGPDSCPLPGRCTPR